MTTRGRRSLLGLVAALALLFGQHTAMAHLIGHATATMAAPSLQGDPEHGAAESLEHICAACVAFAGAAAAAAAISPTINACGHGESPAFLPSRIPSATSPHPYHSRAPPSLQSSV